jgi:hypothetical protein
MLVLLCICRGLEGVVPKVWSQTVALHLQIWYIIRSNSAYNFVMQEPVVDGTAFSGNYDTDWAIFTHLGRAEHMRVYGQNIYINDHA